MSDDEGEAQNNEFGLPDEVLHVLPPDPFTQLDIARKITSLALSTRISALESETSVLRAQVTDRDNIIAGLESQIQSLDATLSDITDRLNRAEHEKETLLKENSSLSNTINKLRRDVAKLEVFRKTLMKSLQEDEDGSVQGAVARGLQSQESLSAQSQTGDDNVTPPPPAYSSTQSDQTSERGNSVADDQDSEASRPRISAGLLLASQTNTPRLTPPASLSATPSKTSKPTSPRRQSVSFSTSRGMFENNDGGSQSGRPRIDGKEFFRQVRSRLSYEQFGAFLLNVKELNSHKQSKEETLRKADEIFGADNKDLYTIFEGLLTRNAH